MRVTARRSWCWGGELRASSGAFIGARGRMAAWARAVGEGPTRGQNRGRSCLAGTGRARHGASSASGRRKPPRGGSLRGRVRFCGPAGDL
jgi:hypothetical protein